VNAVTAAPILIDEAFAALGTTVRVVVESPEARSLVTRARWIVEDYDRRLSRFRPDSELCALNADPRERVPASHLLRDAVRAALWAAERSAGLVDPTLLDDLERAGYTESLAPRGQSNKYEGVRPLNKWGSEQKTGAEQTRLHLGRPRDDQRWRRIRVEGDAVVRPPGMRLDLGGSGKGHVADLVAAILTPERRWAIDCGGDVRVGGVVDQTVVVAHPAGGEAARFTLQRGAVATSAVHARAWPGGHHLLDPATGEPVRTGVIQATAVGTTTLEAETLAKMALLRGTPEILARGGGVVVTEDHEVITR
jgi:thiamine biosynthesis lipoprotein